MRLPFALLCCAAAALDAQTSRARIFLPGYKDPFPIENVTSEFELDAPRSKVYAAMKSAYDDLRVPLDLNDAKGEILGTKSIKALQSFAGIRLSRLVDCGSTTMGQNADSYRVSLVLLTLLDPKDSTHTKVRIGFIGGAEPLASAMRQGVQCGSTGVMEEKLMELARKHLY